MPRDQRAHPVIGVQSQARPFFGVVAVLVVDGRARHLPIRRDPASPTDCSPVSFTGFAGPLNRGDITVVDAQPPPTTKDQGKGDAWKRIGFKNQGLCLAFVDHGS